MPSKPVATDRQIAALKPIRRASKVLHCLDHVGAHLHVDREEEAHARRQSF